MKQRQLFSIIYLFVSFPLAGQIGVDTGAPIITPVPQNSRVMQERLAEYLEQEKNDTGKTPTAITPPLSFDKRLDSLQLVAWQNYYSYMSHGYKHRKNVFVWQLLSSKIIFFVVIFLVLAGLYFAWLQFMHVINNRVGGKTVAEELQTELTASGKEIKVSSPVLGVILLLISLMFFFLYLKYVYPIIETF